MNTEIHALRAENKALRQACAKALAALTGPPGISPSQEYDAIRALSIVLAIKRQDQPKDQGNDQGKEVDRLCRQ